MKDRGNILRFLAVGVFLNIIAGASGNIFPAQSAYGQEGGEEKQAPSLDGTVLHRNENIQTRVGPAFSRVFCFPGGASNASTSFCADSGINQLFLLDLGISLDGDIKTRNSGSLATSETIETSAFFLVDDPPELQRSQSVYTDDSERVRISQIAETVNGANYITYSLLATNIGNSVINDFKVGAYADWEVDESSEGDSAQYSTFADTVFQFEGEGTFVGMSSPTHSSAHHLDFCCGDAAAALGAPNNQNDLLEEDDVTVSLAWSLGSLSPGQTKILHIILAAGTSPEHLVAEIADAKAAAHVPPNVFLAFTQTGEGVFATSAEIGNVAANTTLALEFGPPPAGLDAQLEEIVIPIAEGGNAGTLTVTLFQNVPGGIPPPPSDELAILFHIDFDGDIDFSDPDTFSGNATITTLVNKNIDVDRIEGDPFNCPVVSVFILNESSNVWEPALSVARNPSNDVGTDTETTEDDKCGYIVTHNHTSRFSVGGIKRPTSGGGGGPAYTILDQRGPSIQSYYFKPDVVRKGDTITIAAQIIDDVGVSKAVVFYFNAEESDKKAVSVNMQKINTQWFKANIPSSTPGVKYWIVASDASGNSARIAVQTIPVSESNVASSTSSGKPLFTVVPKDTAEKTFEVFATDGTEAFNSKITIRNLSDEPLKNVRIVVSPGLYKKFFPSEYAIKYIEPKGEKQVDLNLIGRPSTDPDGSQMGYSGQVIVATANNDIAVLNVDAFTEESSHKSTFLDLVADKADMRYKKVNALNLDVIKSRIFKTPYEYDVRSSDGGNSIDDLSDKLIIKNNGDKPLKNVRIFLSSIGKQFLPSQQNIPLIAPEGEFALSLVSKIGTDSGYLHGYKGELVIVPENSVPIAIPVDLPAGSIRGEELGVNVADGSNLISAAYDRVSIKNTGEKIINDVRLVLSQNLARLFTLETNSFKHIEAGTEQVVEIKLRDVNSLVNSYKGHLLVASANQEVKTITIDIGWKEISSEHFMLYARDNSQDIAKAEAVSQFLESNYEIIAERFGELNTKTRIYMVSTIEEMQIVTQKLSHYDYNHDIAFVCGCSDQINELALQEFVYRTIINSNPSYWNKQKILFDEGNWLVDGIVRYAVTEVMAQNGLDATGEMLAVEAEPLLEWYGTDDSQHTNSYTFIEYLKEKYGDKIIDKTIEYLGSGMISNHRCSTLENCAVLRAVYDVSGLDMDNKRYDLSFSSVVNEWEDFLDDVRNSDISIG